MRTVTAEDLAEAIGSADAVYVEEAEQWTKEAGQKSLLHWKWASGGKGQSYAPRLAVAAVCLLLVAAGGAAALRQGGSGELSGGSEGNAGGIDGVRADENGSTSSGSANGAAEAPVFEIPENVTAVTVLHYSCGQENRILAEGGELEAIRDWADGLRLGEPVYFKKGESPGEVSEGGELFFFQFQGADQELSYRDFGDCYLVVGDAWYPVLNPTDPPGGA